MKKIFNFMDRYGGDAFWLSYWPNVISLAINSASLVANFVWPTKWHPDLLTLVNSIGITISIRGFFLTFQYRKRRKKYLKDFQKFCEEREALMVEIMNHKNRSSESNSDKP